MTVGRCRYFLCPASMTRRRRSNWRRNRNIGDARKPFLPPKELWLKGQERTLKPDREKASRRTLRSRRQWQSEGDWSRQWQSEESWSALLDPTLHPPSLHRPHWLPFEDNQNSSKYQENSLPPRDHIDGLSPAIFHCTMCTLFSFFSPRPNEVRHILKF